MPFVSKAQRRYLWATHPAMARRWEEHTSAHAKLPEHKGETPARRAPAEQEKEASAPLTPAAAFKYGFLRRCAEEGLTMEQAALRAEVALAAAQEPTVKTANPAAAAGADPISAITGLLASGGKGLLSMGRGAVGPLTEGVSHALGAALLGLPIAAGVAGGATAASLRRGDTNPGTVKAQELADEYNRLAEEAEQKTKLRNQTRGSTLVRIG